MKKIIISVLLVLTMLTAIFTFTGCFGSSGVEQTAAYGEAIDIEDGLTLTLVDVEEWYGSSSDKLETGNVYVFLHFYAKNNGTEDGYLNSLDETSYCDDIAINPDSLIWDHDGEEIWGNVAPGKSRTGYIAYEVPSSWEKIEFIYEPFLGDKTTFIAEKGDVNKNPIVNQNTNDNSNNNSTVNGIKVGETASYGSFQITFNEVVEYVDTDQFKMDTPAAGKTFIVLHFTVKNVSSSDAYFSSYNEDSYCDDLAINTKTLWNYDGNEIWGDTSAGKTRIGYIAYEVPTDWQKIEFIYDDNITFVAYSSDIQ